jgi:Hydrazine synthase alpha subunit middle domain/WD40-like Beta Propeller Repeat
MYQQRGKLQGVSVGAAVRIAACLATMAGLLGACSAGTKIALGSGQSPDAQTVDFPIFYVKRTVPTTSDDLRLMRPPVPQANLFKRATASPSAAEINVTARITGTDSYDVKDVAVSADAKMVVFAMRGPLTKGMKDTDPPTWAIWQYTIASDTLARVIADDNTANAGEDVAPAFLPDGRIVFASTRQRQSKAVLLDENKPQFEYQTEERTESAFVLHVMNPDGTNIHQIEFNQSHDRDPTVLSSGRVLFTRWDHAPGKDGMHLYSANPDGTDLELYYGANSHSTGPDGKTNTATIEFVKPHEMQDGRILTLIRPYTQDDFGGDLVIIDAAGFVENTQPLLANAGAAGPAQTLATPNDVRTVPGPSPGGRFNSAVPLWDGTQRILVSWSQCRLLDTSVTPNLIIPCSSAALASASVTLAPPLYSVWMFDPNKNTMLPVMQPTEGVMVTDVVAAQPRALPAVILDAVPGVDVNQNLFDASVGVIDIKSVYDFDGVDTAKPNIQTLADPAKTTAAQRPARFIRLQKAVSLPDKMTLNIAPQAFGATPYMREILGYAPVEPDGSVKVEVPANVAFQIDVLDVNGRRISPVHANWLQVRAGEVMTCNGCHTPATVQNPRSHGRTGLFAAVNKGATTSGMPFPNTLSTFLPNVGETMAEARARASCANDSPPCMQMTPSVNVVYQDVWTKPSVRAPDASFAYSYSDPTIITDIPTSEVCVTTWTHLCRITINYKAHIQPLWDKVRQVTDPATGAVLADHTCTQAGCHNLKTAAGAAQVPAGQLNLMNTPATDEPLELTSYRELLFTHAEQTVNMGAVQDVLVPGPPGAKGQATTMPVPVGPYANAGSASGPLSSQFLNRFAANSGSTHAGFLSAAELRMITEWLDIGAQYFNNPFDPAAPLN